MTTPTDADYERLLAERNRWHGLWFYLLCHPEDAESVAKEALFGGSDLEDA